MKKTIKISSLPKEQRPREKLKLRGHSALSDKELLAILLRTGTKGKDVQTVAEELGNLLDADTGIPSIKEISRISGIGLSKACAIAAMLEYGRRRYGATSARIKQPVDIFTLVRHYADRKQEHFISISLNGAHEVIAVRIVTIGLVDKTIVHPREVFADIIADRACAFCVAHNHPSGKVEGSYDDDKITERLKDAARILGLQFVDHVVFSQTAWWSYRENKRIIDDEPINIFN